MKRGPKGALATIVTLIPSARKEEENGSMNVGTVAGTRAGQTAVGKNGYLADLLCVGGDK